MSGAFPGPGRPRLKRPGRPGPGKAEGTSVIKGTSRLENKEGNRAESIREEYAKLGIEVDLY